jgi:hypothetical protein
MSAPRHTGRLRRSFAAVESSYVRDLGDRAPSRAARLAAGPGCRSATERLDGAHRRVRVEIADSRPRHLVASTSGITWLAVGHR